MVDLNLVYPRHFNSPTQLSYEFILIAVREKNRPIAPTKNLYIAGRGSLLVLPEIHRPNGIHTT